eukprot:Hpha_TRINITY_DN9335_c0_g1::TRINITY_DN9335_c0_g1_i1::g.26058::m.26058
MSGKQSAIVSAAMEMRLLQAVAGKVLGRRKSNTDQDKKKAEGMDSVGSLPPHPSTGRPRRDDSGRAAPAAAPPPPRPASKLETAGRHLQQLGAAFAGFRIGIEPPTPAIDTDGEGFERFPLTPSCSDSEATAPDETWYPGGRKTLPAAPRNSGPWHGETPAQYNLPPQKTVPVDDFCFGDEADLDQTQGSAQGSGGGAGPRRARSGSVASSQGQGSGKKHKSPRSKAMTPQSRSLAPLVGAVGSVLGTAFRRAASISGEETSTRLMKVGAQAAAEAAVSLLSPGQDSRSRSRSRSVGSQRSIARTILDRGRETAAKMASAAAQLAPTPELRTDVHVGFSGVDFIDEGALRDRTESLPPEELSVTVQGLSTGCSRPLLLDFFDFCGDVLDFEMEPDPLERDKIVGVVVFGQRSAVEIAVMLSGATVEGDALEISAVVPSEETEAARKEVMAAARRADPVAMIADFAKKATEQVSRRASGNLSGGSPVAALADFVRKAVDATPRPQIGKADRAPRETAPPPARRARTLSGILPPDPGERQTPLGGMQTPASERQIMSYQRQPSFLTCRPPSTDEGEELLLESSGCGSPVREKTLAIDVSRRPFLVRRFDGGMSSDEISSGSAFSARRSGDDECAAPLGTPGEQSLPAGPEPSGALSSLMLPEAAAVGRGDARRTSGGSYSEYEYGRHSTLSTTMQVCDSLLVQPLQLSASVTTASVGCTLSAPCTAALPAVAGALGALSGEAVKARPSVQELPTVRPLRGPPRGSSPHSSTPGSSGGSAVSTSTQQVTAGMSEEEIARLMDNIESARRRQEAMFERVCAAADRWAAGVGPPVALEASPSRRVAALPQAPETPSKRVRFSAARSAGSPAPPSAPSNWTPPYTREAKDRTPGLRTPVAPPAPQAVELLFLRAELPFSDPVGGEVVVAGSAQQVPASSPATSGQTQRWSCGLPLPPDGGGGVLPYQADVRCVLKRLNGDRFEPQFEAVVSTRATAAVTDYAVPLKCAGEEAGMLYLRLRRTSLGPRSASPSTRSRSGTAQPQASLPPPGGVQSDDPIEVQLAHLKSELQGCLQKQAAQRAALEEGVRALNHMQIEGPAKLQAAHQLQEAARAQQVALRIQSSDLRSRCEVMQRILERNSHVTWRPRLN